MRISQPLSFVFFLCQQQDQLEQKRGSKRAQKRGGLNFCLIGMRKFTTQKNHKEILLKEEIF